ncbi:SpoIIE family protein phosphatase [Methylomagnum ishizawai]|uniref:SpoIIE family protein phosphatase n=1 Tax=Methylomagnum ishizawai TaxID=1760988 RepID=UPI001C343871|nr:SpoIIE family protein phosphatase [Methylomagnum ishizawai]BBL73741.1 hypothetical protein MishRS11D_08390 [Methylomagnum ishizawai]
MNDTEHTTPMDEDKTGFFAPGPSIRKDGDDGNAHYLLVIAGSERGQTVELGEQPLTIGRHSDNALRLPDHCVSKQHCRVSLQHPLVWVEDLGSTNGTFIDERKIAGQTLWPVDGLLRIGNHVLKHEYRHKPSMRESETLAADLQKASEYVQSLLPPPLGQGPVRVDWCFVPSAVLGGDGLGYGWLDADRFAFYLVDVCGHGVGPAMHAVSVLNVLRHKSLANVDFGQPAQVLNGLNAALGMEQHGEMFFSIWYGVYRVSTRHLVFASGGHPPALLLSPGRDAARDLTTGGLFVGVLPTGDFQQQELALPPASTLWVYSDGVFEISLPDGGEWSLGEFRALATGQPDPVPAQAVYREIAALARQGRISDDFSLMILRFP